MEMEPFPFCFRIRKAGKDSVLCFKPVSLPDFIKGCLHSFITAVFKAEDEGNVVNMTVCCKDSGIIRPHLDDRAAEILEILL
jgi:hypothetical protein